MKITSPQEKWKIGDTFMMRRPDNTYLLGLARKVRFEKLGIDVLYQVLASSDPSENQTVKGFYFTSTNFERNRIFRLEDDLYRTFKVVFGEDL